MNRGWLAAGAVLLALGACAKEQPKPAAPPPGPAKGSKEWKIENAMSAGPASISAAATVMDWPSSPTGQMTQLRAGTNGWTCLPDMPDTPTNDPWCLDGTTGKWVGAWMAHKAPNITVAGLTYMLQGSADASNTDPYKMKPDSGQEWVITGPHIMVFAPNPAAAFRGMSTDWKSGGPYVMFAGTPYAHLMVPVAPAKHEGMSGM